MSFTPSKKTTESVGLVSPSAMFTTQCLSSPIWCTSSHSAVQHALLQSTAFHLLTKCFCGWLSGLCCLTTFCIWSTTSITALKFLTMANSHLMSWTTWVLSVCSEREIRWWITAVRLTLLIWIHLPRPTKILSKALQNHSLCTRNQLSKLSQLTHRLHHCRQQLKPLSKLLLGGQVTSKSQKEVITGVLKGWRLTWRLCGFLTLFSYCLLCRYGLGLTGQSESTRKQRNTSHLKCSKTKSSSKTKTKYDTPKLCSN